MGALLLNKTTIFVTFFLLGIGQIYSQMGCTDPLANNYDSGATQNDGSCSYDNVSVSTTNTYTLDELLHGTSGLIYWNDKLWTHNDSSDTNLYELDPSDGSITNSVSLDPQVNQDWEEISQDEEYVYVGDFGNNVNGNRTNLKIIRVSKISILTGTPEMDIIDFTYEDQTDFTPKGANNTNYDCEAFIVKDDCIYLFTKEWVSNKTRIYALPKTPGTHQAEIEDSYDVGGLITGAVYKKDQGLIVLSGYSNLMQPFVFLLYDYPEKDFFSGNKRKLKVNLPFHQVEAITTEDGLNYYISNERFDVTETIQQLHTLDLTPYLDGYLNVSPIQGPAQFKVYPNPTTSTLEVMGSQSLFPIKYTVVDMAGKKVKEGMLIAQNITVDVSNLPAGTYILKLGKEVENSCRFIKK